MLILVELLTITLEVIVSFVNIGGIVDHRCLEVIVVLLILVELLTITV